MNARWLLSYPVQPEFGCGSVTISFSSWLAANSMSSVTLPEQAGMMA